MGSMVRVKRKVTAHLRTVQVQDCCCFQVFPWLQTTGSTTYSLRYLKSLDIHIIYIARYKEDTIYILAVDKCQLDVLGQGDVTNIDPWLWPLIIFFVTLVSMTLMLPGAKKVQD